MAEQKKIDCRGLRCPQPVTQTREALAAMSGGELMVLLDNEAACSNVSLFAAGQGHAVIRVEQDGGYDLLIEKDGGSGTCEAREALGGPQVRTPMAVYINAETMGRGDDELGRVIMGAYMETLLHFARDISHIIFVNSGVRLACEGSPVIDHLKDLADMDIEILCCGTCLNHFNIKEKLQIGKVSNMFTILEIISKAGKVLSP